MKKDSPYLHPPKYWLVWSIVLFALTFGLGFVAKAFPAIQFASLDVTINNVHNSALDTLALILDKLDRPLTVGVILAITFVILTVFRGWRLALGVSAVTGLGWVSTLAVKAIVAQPRPDSLGLTHQLDVDPATLSYPSGHVVFVVAFVVALTYAFARPAYRLIIVLLGAVLILITAWSRLYLGVHYVTDVVGAVLNGVAGVMFFAGLWNLFVVGWLKKGGFGRHS